MSERDPHAPTPPNTGPAHQPPPPPPAPRSAAPVSQPPTAPPEEPAAAPAAAAAPAPSPREQTPSGPGSAPAPQQTSEPEPRAQSSSQSSSRSGHAHGGQDDPLRGSFTSHTWIAIIALIVLLVLLAVFILQNTDTVAVNYFGFTGQSPLAVALLLAFAAGLLVAGIAGTLRIWQLRRRVRKLER